MRVTEYGNDPKNLIVRRSPPRHSPPQTFATPDVHHPHCKIRRSPPQTFTTPDVHHLRRLPPQTFTTPFEKSDVHHPQTFTTSDFTTLLILKCDIHHPGLSPPPTFTNHHPRHSPPPTYCIYIYHANNWGMCVSW